MRISRFLIGFTIFATVISAVVVIHQNKKTYKVHDSDEDDMDGQDSITEVIDTIEETKRSAAVVKVKEYEVGEGELGLFDLRGPVESCTMPDEHGFEHTYTFNKRGFWLTEDGKTLKELFIAGVTRDGFGRIIEGNTDDYYAMFYKWNTHGQIKESWNGEYDTKYYYGLDNSLVRQTISYHSEPGDETPDVVVKRSYDILEKDIYGNWIKRKDNKKKIETRQITYYDGE